MIRKFGFLIFIVLIGTAGLSYAEETKAKTLQAIEFFTGFGKAKLHAQGNSYFSPLIVDIDFNLKPLVKNIDFLPGLLQFQLEPYISPIYQPRQDIEIGAAFMLKIGLLPETSKFQPYIKGGTGLLYMTLHTREQSTQFNFFEQGGFGFHYFITNHTALNLECRMRHTSNCDIKKPNHGINSLFALMGVSYRF